MNRVRHFILQNTGQSLSESSRKLRKPLETVQNKSEFLKKQCLPPNKLVVEWKFWAFSFSCYNDKIELSGIFSDIYIFDRPIYIEISIKHDSGWINNSLTSVFSSSWSIFQVQSRYCPTYRDHSVEFVNCMIMVSNVPLSSNNIYIDELFASYLHSFPVR